MERDVVVVAEEEEEKEEEEVGGRKLDGWAGENTSHLAPLFPGDREGNFFWAFPGLVPAACFNNWSAGDNLVPSVAAAGSEFDVLLCEVTARLPLSSLSSPAVLRFLLGLVLGDRAWKRNPVIDWPCATASAPLCIEGKQNFPGCKAHRGGISSLASTFEGFLGGQRWQNVEEWACRNGWSASDLSALSLLWAFLHAVLGGASAHSSRIPLLRHGVGRDQSLGPETLKHA
jgi:hypothetical protein